VWVIAAVTVTTSTTAGALRWPLDNGLSNPFAEEIDWRVLTQTNPTRSRVLAAMAA
jgi:hypothetical protein